MPTSQSTDKPAATHQAVRKVKGRTMSKVTLAGPGRSILTTEDGETKVRHYTGEPESVPGFTPEQSAAVRRVWECDVERVVAETEEVARRATFDRQLSARRAALTGQSSEPTEAAHPRTRSKLEMMLDRGTLGKKPDPGKPDIAGRRYAAGLQFIEQHHQANAEPGARAINPSQIFVGYRPGDAEEPGEAKRQAHKRFCVTCAKLDLRQVSIVEAVVLLDCDITSVVHMVEEDRKPRTLQNRATAILIESLDILADHFNIPRNYGARQIASSPSGASWKRRISVAL